LPRRPGRVIEVLAIHALVIDEFGGADAVRDLGALEAAVFRPQTGYYEDSIAEVAALFESITQNHPILGGKSGASEMSGVWVQRCRSFGWNVASPISV